MLVSGGADSVCLLDASVRLGARVTALHVNYGLREGADGDEALCRELCERLGVELSVESVALDSAAEGAGGNLQAEARKARYARADAAAERSGGDFATAHTLSDQAETVVYRLAVSPGRRALLGMAPRRGRLVRPLLAATRAETREYCRARGLAWRDDPSNADRRFARARVREEVLPALRDLSPAAEQTIAETALRLRDEHEVLEAAVDEALEGLGGGPAMSLAGLRELPAGLARLVLRRLAEDESAGAVVLSRGDADAILALGERGGTASLDLGGSLRALVEYGTLHLVVDSESELAVPEAATLPVPGRARFGVWDVEARVVSDDPGHPARADYALVSAELLGPQVTVRAWRPGDRIRLVGLGGSKSLQDLFVDAKVPRALRRTLPVAESGGEIVWVAGLAVGERFRPARGARAKALVELSARRRGA